MKLWAMSCKTTQDGQVTGGTLTKCGPLEDKPLQYSCYENLKKAEHQRIDAFGMWCWRRLLRVLWTIRRLNQSILKEINPECSLEGLKLKLQYFGHLTWRANSLEKTLMLGKIEGGRRGQQVRWLDSVSDQWTWIWANSRR